MFYFAQRREVWLSVCYTCISLYLQKTDLFNDVSFIKNCTYGFNEQRICDIIYLLNVPRTQFRNGKKVDYNIILSEVNGNYAVPKNKLINKIYEDTL